MTVAITARTPSPTAPIDDRSPAGRQQRPDEDESRLQLDGGPGGGAQAQADRVIEPPPADREREVQQRPHLPELDRVDERPRQAGEEHDPPAHRTRDRQDRGADEERRDEERRPDPDGRAGRQQAERKDERNERRRVIEQPERAARLEREVVDRLAVEQAGRRLVIGEEVVAACVAGDGKGGPDGDRERQARDDRQRRPSQWAEAPIPGHAARSGPRPRPRWMSGIRNRSQATRMARPGRARIREPRRSYQWIGTIAIR